MDMSKLYIFLGVVALSWMIILALERMGKLKAERHLILLIVRTERGKELISRLASYRGFWRVFGSIGIVIGFLGMLLVMYSIAQSLYSKYVAGVPMVGVQAVIPGVTIPFWYGIVGLITVLVVHEIAHGIIARSEGITLKSLGVVFLTIIPIGAFVEPDEEELKSKTSAAKLRVYAVGSFGNILLALLAFLGIIFVTNNFFDTTQVQITEVGKGTPADGLLNEGMIIQEINGATVTSLPVFFKIMRDVKARDIITLKTDQGLYTLTTAAKKENPELGYIGVVVNNAVKDSVSKVLGLTLPLVIYFSLYWIFFLNQGIGLINLAPLHLGIAATDGHHMLREVLSRFIKEGSADKLSFFISGLTMLAILFTVIRIPANLFG